MGNEVVKGDEITINGNPIVDSNRNNRVPFRELRHAGTKAGKV